jgi:hypothetical protein
MRAIFDACDQFPTLLGDPAKRDRLERLGAEDAGSDPVFTEPVPGRAYPFASYTAG